MKFDRSSGILLHPTSLPGPYGIGDLGPQVFKFIDFLAGTGGKLWQVLPLGPTGYGDSPYQCFSAFAGNPYLISPERLLDENLLHPNDLANLPNFPANRVDFGWVIPWKLNLLERAFIRFQNQASPVVRQAFEAFRAEQASWLEDYALFMAIKEANGGGGWENWPEALRRREPDALAEARHSLENAVLRFMFYQFIFYRQWSAVKTYANGRGIKIIGDIPIFVAYDSADVWANPELFYLDEASKPTVVAGVPPDYFSPTGQLWGNPLYKWAVHKERGYDWWISRFKAILHLVDIVRLDHFRGFAGYWEIPAGEPTAVKGRWVPGPGDDFMQAIRDGLGDPSTPLSASLPIIAEDLGEITPDVVKLRDDFNLPGMKILQFGFSGPDNPFLPHLYPENCVTYTGTHDNDTAQGWYNAASDAEKDFAQRYLDFDGSNFAWRLTRACWASTAVFALAPLQDLLGLGTAARMNYPSRLGGNWEWRFQPEDLSVDLRERLKELNFLYLR